MRYVHRNGVVNEEDRARDYAKTGGAEDEFLRNFPPKKRYSIRQEQLIEANKSKRMIAINYGKNYRFVRFQRFRAQARGQGLPFSS